MSEQRYTEVWNSGGGTQSSAIAALIVQGELEPPDLAVIADTGLERSTTWDYLERWVAPALADVGVTIQRVPASDYATVGLWGGKDGDSLLIPAFTTAGGDVGKLPNFCSNEWKTRVVQRWLRRAHGIKNSDALHWLGFSTDELIRARRRPKARFPLVERRMRRGDCIALVLRMGWPLPPSSSCWMCPNHNMQEWREIREHPEDWPRVVKFDRMIRRRDPHAYLTAECKPIEECEFDDAQEVMFDRQCDSGNCFV